MVAPLIPASAMTVLKGIDERAMPDTCRVLRRTQTVSGGRVTYGDETVVATLPCRFATPRTAREMESLGRMAEEAAGFIYLPVVDSIPDVTSSDRIDRTADGLTQVFEVIGDPVRGTFDTNLPVPVKREG